MVISCAVCRDLSGKLQNPTQAILNIKGIYWIGELGHQAWNTAKKHRNMGLYKGSHCSLVTVISDEALTELQPSHPPRPRSLLT